MTCGNARVADPETPLARLLYPQDKAMNVIYAIKSRPSMPEAGWLAAFIWPGLRCFTQRQLLLPRMLSVPRYLQIIAVDQRGVS